MQLIKELTRDEMRNIMAGSGGDYSCKCYTSCPDGEYLGKVTCTEATGQLECCYVAYEETGCTECTNTNPVEG